MNLIICLLTCILVLPAALPAAEVTNLKVGQSGDTGFATYDLRGEVGERDTEVTVTLTIAGRKYESDRLTLTGDFGKKVKTGVGKRIVWDTLADISSGFDGEVIWDVATVGSSVPIVVKETQPAPPPAASPRPPASNDLPFEFSKLVARDKNTGLLWLRTVSKDGTGVTLSKARRITLDLKTERFAGCYDWEIPSVETLNKIISYAFEAGYKGKKSKGYPADYFNAIGFTGVANDFYWTESIDIQFGFPHEQRMAVDFEDGIASRKSVPKDYLQFWPVCKPD